MQIESFIAGKDASLESSISVHAGKTGGIGFHIENAPGLNPGRQCWSVCIHARPRLPAPVTNGKGASEKAGGRAL